MRNSKLYRKLTCYTHKETLAKNMFTLAKYFDDKYFEIQTIEIFRK